MHPDLIEAHVRCFAQDRRDEEGSQATFICARTIGAPPSRVGLRFIRGAAVAIIHWRKLDDAEAFTASFAVKRRKSFSPNWCSGRDTVRFICRGHFMFG